MERLWNFLEGVRHHIESFGLTGMNSSFEMNAHHKDYGLWYAMAIEAEKECDQLCKKINLGKKRKCLDSQYASFMECSLIKTDLRTHSVDLVIYIGGVINDHDVVSALGFSLDDPLKICLKFDESWSHVELDTLSITPGNMVGSKVIAKMVHVFTQYFVEKRIPHATVSAEIVPELRRISVIENYFVGMTCFICRRLSALPDCCIICWSLFPYAVSRVLSCCRDFCLFSFEELGLGTHVVQELRQSPEIVDFQLSIAYAAAHSLKDVFEPFPSFLLEEQEIRPRSGWFGYQGRLVNDTESSKRQQSRENKNLILLRFVLMSYPSVKNMTDCVDDVQLMNLLSKCWREFKKRIKQPKLDDKWFLKMNLPFDLLRFIVLTNRSTFHLLTAEEKLGIADTVYEFAVLHDSPEREANFQHRKIKKGGSFFAFHGSPTLNWFSILRNGLRCLSGTSHMLCGATYGHGIYLARDAKYSIKYSPPFTGLANGELSEPFRVLAICEVVKSSVKTKVKGQIFVVQPENEKDVVVRYILVLKTEDIQHQCSILGGTLVSNTNIDLRNHFQNLCLKYHRRQYERQLENKKKNMASSAEINEGDVSVMVPSTSYVRSPSLSFPLFTNTTKEMLKLTKRSIPFVKYITGS